MLEIKQSPIAKSIEILDLVSIYAISLNISLYSLELVYYNPLDLLVLRVDILFI